MIEGQNGLTWEHWKKAVSLAEDLGFTGLFRSDHFTNASPPDKDSLELWVSLSYLASHTSRIHFGPLVCPTSVRHPAMIARQAAALDDLSSGRFVFGMGAGWQDREHQMYSFDLGDIPTRMGRLEDGLEVATRLLRSDDPVSFKGDHFQLDEATLLPRPQRPGGPPVLVGGNGPKRTLPLVARFADVWNAIFLPPDDYAERVKTLDSLAEDAGRKPSDIRKTLMTGFYFGADEAALSSRLEPLRQNPQLADASTEDLLERLHARGAVAGTPDDVKAQLKEFDGAGVEEIMLQWLDLENLDGLKEVAEALI